MSRVQISLRHGDLLSTPAALAFVKHIEGVSSTPEAALDVVLGGRLSAKYKLGERKQYVTLDSLAGLPYPKLYVLNFHEDDLPFEYPSVDDYARRIVQYAEREQAANVVTAVHGPGAGLDASAAMETMLSAFAREYQMREGFEHVREIVLVEKDPKIFGLLSERLEHILKDKKIIERSGEDVFIRPVSAAGLADAAADSHAMSEHLFVAMPFAKKLNNVFLYGIKKPVEERSLKCERSDYDKFTGDIVERLKKRIETARMVIADLTGNNPNVFYEVGYADALNKKIILISQKRTRPMFDLRNQHQIRYDPADIEAVEKQIGSLLDVLLGERVL